MNGSRVPSLSGGGGMRETIMLAVGAPPVDFQEPPQADCQEVFACDLPKDFSENDVRQLFGTYGELRSVPVFRQGEHSTTVVVEYCTCQAAAEAQATLDHALVRGRGVRCLLASSLALVQETLMTGQRLLLEDLDFAIESHRLHDVCSLFGKVLDSNVEPDSSGRSRGYGFVHYASLEDATRAMESLHGTEVGTAKIKVRPFEWNDHSRFELSDVSYLMDNRPQMDAGWGSMHAGYGGGGYGDHMAHGMPHGQLHGMPPGPAHNMGPGNGGMPPHGMPPGPPQDMPPPHGILSQPEPIWC